MNDAFAKGTDKVDYHDYYKYRIAYITESNLKLTFLFVTGLTDNSDNIKKELIKCKKEFLNLFEDIIKHKYDDKTFEVFDPTIDAIHKNLRPKISLVGFSGVGKTTITRLIKAEEIPMQHIPTITGDIATIKIGKLHFHLWDFAGQEQFSYLWNNFIKGSDAVLLITDSTLENVEKSKFFLELIKEQAPHAHTAVIGNKQDLDNAMKPGQIDKILGLKTYSMIAKDPTNRDRMITIVADVLEMSAEVSPLLQPLLERDNYIEEATKALENTEFEKAANIFEKISDLCIELGDDSLGREFFEKSQKIMSMLRQVSAPTPPATPPPEVKEASKELPKPIEEVSPEIEIIETSEQDITLKKPKVPIKPPSFKKTVPKAPPPPIDEKKQIESTEISPPPPPPPKEVVSEPENVEKPEPITPEMGLNLNPKDFMVKERPKSITSVPKDAKTKLKTSPYGHVSNEPVKMQGKVVDPTKLIQPKPISTIKPPELKETSLVPKPSQLKTSSTAPMPVENKETISSNLDAKKLSIPPETSIEGPSQTIYSTTPEKTLNLEHKSKIEKSLMDLKIKKANMSKMALEFDMKELTGEITAKELEEKKGKLKVIEADINNQIKELEDLLKKFD